MCVHFATDYSAKETSAQSFETTSLSWLCLISCLLTFALPHLLPHLWSPLWLNNKLPRLELTDKLRQNDVLKFCTTKWCSRWDVLIFALAHKSWAWRGNLDCATMGGNYFYVLYCKCQIASTWSVRLIQNILTQKSRNDSIKFVEYFKYVHEQ